VPKRAPSFLEAHEVPRVLAELSPGDRDMVAVAVYAGLRKGDLFGLRKRDVDLARHLLMVTQSYDRGTTKGRREESVPVAPGLVPYLEHALSASPGGLLFPRPDGSMRTKEDKLADRLQGALNRAGIVEGWRHVCRWWKLHPEPNRYEESHSDNARRRCPVCSRMLFPRAVPRRFRLHDTRHTAATLMLAAGVDLYAVAKILRHKDPRVTFDTYSHLVPGYLRTQIDKVDLGASLAGPVQTTPARSGTAMDAGLLGGASVHSSPGRNGDGTKRSPPEQAAFVHSSLLSREDRFAGSSRPSLAIAGDVATPVPQPIENASEAAREILPVSEGAQVAGATGFEPVAFGFGVCSTGLHNPPRNTPNRVVPHG
jgi:integrase-like protein